jgi:FMN phosphatase YigB (HAD superfamily)
VTAERLQKLHEKYVTKIDEDIEEDIELVSSKSGKRSFLRKIPDKKIALTLQHYSPIKEEEEEKEEEEKVEEEKEVEEKEEEKEFGEYTEFFQNLKPDVQEKIRKYPKEKQLEILRKLQKPNKKVVTIGNTK